MATAPALFLIFLSRRFSSLLGDLHVYAFAFERLEREVRLLTVLVTVDTAISIGLPPNGMQLSSENNAAEKAGQHRRGRRPRRT
ncbi:hypothetical protein C8J56DRAFT_958586, partial [Mycena floridula]